MIAALIAALLFAPMNVQDPIQPEVEFYVNDQNGIEVSYTDEGMVLFFYPRDEEDGDCGTVRSFCPQLDVPVGYLYNGGPIRDVDNKCTFNVRSIVLNGLKTLRVRVNSYCARDFGREYAGDYPYDGWDYPGQD